MAVIVTWVHIDNTRTSSTLIYFAKSPKMVQLLVEKGVMSMKGTK